VSFSTTGGAFGEGPPSSFGRDTAVNQQNENQNQGNQCASPGGNQENCQGQQGQP
jgi:hypothetical protein